MERGNIRRLADRIGKKAHRNACLKITHLNFRLHGRIPLQPGNGNQIHIIKRKLAQFRNLGLNKKSGLCRIKPAGQIIQRHFNNILTHLLRIVCIIGQRLRICDHNKNLIIFSGILKLHSPLQG